MKLGIRKKLNTPVIEEEEKALKAGLKIEVWIEKEWKRKLLDLKKEHNIKERNYHYHTNCLSSTSELISDMWDQAIYIKYETILKHVPFSEIRKVLPFYAYNTRKGGLILKNDWHVGYYKSFYNNIPCYFICHSHIEYIWIKN